MAKSSRKSRGASGASSKSALAASKRAERSKPVPAPALPPLPSPEPPKAALPPDNPHRRYLDAAAAIFAGKITPIAELFQPLEEFDPLEHRLLGRVNDRRAHEFLSLGIVFKQESLRVPFPKTPAEIDQRKKEKERLNQLSELALSHFWEFVRAEIPHTRMKDNIKVLDNWQIVTTSPIRGTGPHNDLRHDPSVANFMSMLESFMDEGSEATLGSGHVRRR